MTCPNCGEETQGIKLNNRLYCTNCGFLLSKPTTTTAEMKEVVEEKQVDSVAPALVTPTEKTKEPEPKVISPENEEFAIAPLEAEEAVLDLIEKEAIKLDKTEKKSSKKIDNPADLPVATTGGIIKHNRHRTDQKMEGPFPLVPGEPDPIKEPEIEAASSEIKEESDLGETVEFLTADTVPENLELDKETENKEPHSQNNKTEVEKEMTPSDDNTPEKEKPKTPALYADGKTGAKKESPLLGYFQKAAAEANHRAIRPQKKKKKGFPWKLTLAIGIPVIIIIILVGLVAYVNIFATNPNHALKVAESQSSFEHLKPSYLPAGYSLSYQTSGDANSINYVYDYLPDTTKTLNITAAKSDITSENISAKLLTKDNQPYSNIIVDGRSLWYLGDDTLYYAQNGILYTVKTNSDLSKTELTNVSLGLK